MTTHKYLICIPENLWFYLKGRANFLGIPVSHVIRNILMEDWEEKMYGKGGMFPDGSETVKPFVREDKKLEPIIFQFLGGDGRHFRGAVNYLVSEDKSIYAEVKDHQIKYQNL